MRGLVVRARKGGESSFCWRFPSPGEGGSRWAIVAGPGPAAGSARDGVAEVPGDRLHRILAEFSAGGQGWSSARLCGACPGIAGVTGAGVMLMSGEIPRGSLCTSDGVSHLIEELQYTLGEGPCVDAYQQDGWWPSRTWPIRRPAGGWLLPASALQAGARAVFGFPLRVGTVRLGALNLYRDRPGPLSGDQHADALVVADVAARWVLEAQAGAPPDVVAKELERWRRLPLRGA